MTSRLASPLSRCRLRPRMHRGASRLRRDRTRGTPGPMPVPEAQKSQRTALTEVDTPRAPLPPPRVLRVDAHADYPDRYCKRLLEVQTRTRADSVVVGIHTAGHSG